MSKVIAITGGIGSGKTTVFNFLKSLGYHSINLDVISREITLPNTKSYHDIVLHFGEGILNADKTINRQKLRDTIFNDKKDKQVLENITHPEILKELQRRINEYQQNKPIFVEFPLIVELMEQGQKFSYIDEIWLIISNNQLEQSIQRDNQDTQSIIQQQEDNDTRKKYADIIIENNGTVKELYTKVKELLIEKSLVQE